MVLRKRISVLLLTGLFGGLLPASPLRAGIISYTGDVEIVSAPRSVRRDVYENTSLARVFSERTGVQTAAVTINAVLPGRYNAYSDFQDASIADPPAFDTWFLHFDPVGSMQGTVVGSITFSRPLLGVIGRSRTMQQTDRTLGGPGTLYPTNRFNREPEYMGRGNFDRFDISADMRTFDFRLRATDLDQLRIVVSAVPEPGTGIMFGVILACVAGCRRKR